MRQRPTSILSIILLGVLAIASACAPAVYQHVLVEPPGTFTDVDIRDPDPSGLVVRIIESGPGFHEYQAVLQTYERERPSSLTIVSATWENSPRTQCDQITFAFPPDMPYAGSFRDCVGIKAMVGELTGDNGKVRRMTLRIMNDHSKLPT
jgi:hypothetical protein